MNVSQAIVNMDKCTEKLCVAQLLFVQRCSISSMGSRCPSTGAQCRPLLDDTATTMRWYEAVNSWLVIS